MEVYTAFIVLLCLFCLRYFRVFRIPETSDWTLPLAFIAKVSAGLFFLYVYSHYYGNGDLSADASVFLHDGKVLNTVFYESPADYFRFLFGLEDTQLIQRYLGDTSHWDAGPNTLLNDSQNILRIHSVIHFFSFNSPLIHLLVMCFISLIGIRQLALAVIPLSNVKPGLIFWAIVLLPSALLWTSGIIKEPVLMLGIGFLVRTLIGQLPLRRRLSYGFIGILIMAGVKPYVILCFLPAMVVYAVFHYLRPWVAWCVIALGTLACVLLITTGEAPSLVRKLTAQQHDFVNIGRGGVYARGDSCIFIIEAKDRSYLRIDSNRVVLTKTIHGEYMFPYQKTAPKPTIIHPNKEPWILYYNGRACGSYIHVTYIDHSGTQLIRNIPEALTNSLLRPFPNDPPGHVMMWLAVIEEWLLLSLFLVALVRRRILPVRSVHILFALLTFALVLAVMIGWTTPVLGAIVRYRVPVQLALLIAALILLQPPKRLSNE